MAIHSHKKMGHSRHLHGDDCPLPLAQAHRSRRSRKPCLQRLAGPVDGKGTGARTVFCSPRGQRTGGLDVAAYRQPFGFCGGGENCSFALRTDFLLGSVFSRCRCERPAPVVSRSMHRHAGLRIFLQHGFPELLLVARIGFFQFGRFVAGKGIGANHRFVYSAVHSAGTPAGTHLACRNGGLSPSFGRSCRIGGSWPRPPRLRVRFMLFTGIWRTRLGFRSIGCTVLFTR